MKKYSISILTLFLCLTFISVNLFAQTPPKAVYVNAATGNDANDGLSWATAVATIQAGINKTTWGGTDTILVENGIYSQFGTLYIGYLFKIKSVNGPANCIIDFSSQTSGDGIALSDEGAVGPIIEGFTIQNSPGTGITAWGGSYPTIINNIITGHSGHGINIPPPNSAVLISNNTISGNGGSGVFLDSHVEASGFDVENNDIYSNGTYGIYSDGGYIGINNNNIHGNTSGGIYVNSTWSTIDGNTIYNNPTGISLWFVYNFTLTNNVVYGNSVNGFYGESITGNIYNCTFTENTNGVVIEAMEVNSTVSMINSIAYDNTSMDINLIANAYPNVDFTVSYSDIKNGQAGIIQTVNPQEFGLVNLTYGAGNIDLDPKFVNAAANDYHLTDYSKLIGAGTATGAPATDKDGITRGSPPDMGAFENSRNTPLQLSTVYVSTTGNDNNLGTSGSPFATIQKGIDEVAENGTVIVLDGTYSPYNNINLNKSLTLRSQNGAADCFIDLTSGGFKINSTGKVGAAPATAGGYSIYISDSTKTTVVDGFTVTNSYGDGISVSSARTTIQNNIITGNRNHGIYVDNGFDYVKIISNEIYNNGTIVEGVYGDGVYFSHFSQFLICDVELTGNTIYNNASYGFYAYKSSTDIDAMVLENNVIHDNNNGVSITGFDNFSLSNNAVYKNINSGIYIRRGIGQIINSTIADNETGVYITYDPDDQSSSVVTLTNSIVYNNSVNEIYLSLAELNVSYCDIKNDQAGIFLETFYGSPTLTYGAGNISGDPLFVNAAGNDYHLTDFSPCINAGTGAGAPLLDIEGNSRGTPPDMGAYENTIVVQPDPPAATGFEIVKSSVPGSSDFVVYITSITPETVTQLKIYYPVGDPITIPAAELSINTSQIVLTQAPSVFDLQLGTYYARVSTISGVNYNTPNLDFRPHLTISADSLDFGTLDVGYPDTLVISGRNSGGAPLNITSVTAPSGFSAVPDSALGVLAGDSVLFDVIFSPEVENFFSGSVTFTSNDLLNPVQDVFVEGNAIIPVSVTGMEIAAGQAPGTTEILVYGSNFTGSNITQIKLYYYDNSNGWTADTTFSVSDLTVTSGLLTAVKNVDISQIVFGDYYVRVSTVAQDNINTPVYGYSGGVVVTGAAISPLGSDIQLTVSGAFSSLVTGDISSLRLTPGDSLFTVDSLIYNASGVTLTGPETITGLLSGVHILTLQYGEYWAELKINNVSTRYRVSFDFAGYFDLYQVTSYFESGSNEGWRLTGDGSYKVESGTGIPGNSLRVDDPASGSHNYLYAPPKFLGSWSNAGIDDYLTADIYVHNISGSTIPSGWVFVISGPGGSARSVSASAQDVLLDSWNHYSAPIDSASWQVTEGTWESLLAEVESLRIRAEYLSDGREYELFDNVALTFSPAPVPVAIPVTSDFESGLDNWVFENTAAVSVPSSGGNPGAYVRISDEGGITSTAYAPYKFTGDWSQLDGAAAVMVDFKITFSSGSALPRDHVIKISGPGGEAVIGAGDGISAAYNDWGSFTFMISEEEWEVMSGSWASLLGNVTEVKLEPEFINGSETVGMDNFRITNEKPVTGFAADRLYTFPGDTVRFTDMTAGNPFSWNWSFGDGRASSLENPYHIYKEAGLFNVQLITTNLFGSDTLFREAYIEVPAYNGNVLFADDFDDGEVHPAWLFRNGTWEEREGYMVQTSNYYTSGYIGGAYAIVGGDLWSGYKVEADLYSTDNDKIGLVFNYIDSKNFYIFTWQQEGSVRAIKKFVNGVEFTLVSDRIQYITNTWYHVGITASAGQILCSVDGEKIFNIVDATFTRGRAGLYCHGNQSSYWDNFSVSLVELVPVVFGFEVTHLALGQTTVSITGDNFESLFGAVDSVLISTDFEFAGTVYSVSDILVNLDYDLSGEDNISGVISANISDFTPGLYYIRLYPTGKNPVTTPYFFEGTSIPTDIPPVYKRHPFAQTIGVNLAEIYFAADKPVIAGLYFNSDSLFASGEYIDFHDSTLSREHEFLLTGLFPGTRYRFFTKIYDKYGNGPVRSITGVFLTLGKPDTSPPVILGGPTEQSIDTSSASIVWETDEPASGAVYVYLSGAASDTSIFVQEGLFDIHRVDVTGLKANTTYDYLVSSADALGNGPVLSAQKRFKTLAQKDQTPPRIVFGPVILNLTHERAVVKFKTNEYSFASVNYDSTVSLGTLATDKEVDITHSIILDGLSGAKTYYFQVQGIDGSGNAFVFPPEGVDRLLFTTPPVPASQDTTPPIILEGPAELNINADKMIIYWKTNVLANSTVEYGATELLDKMRTYSDLEIGHRVSLTNLEPGTKYYYRVRSMKENNREVVSDIITVNTLAQLDTLPPVITAGPIPNFVGTDKAAIWWKTDKNSSSLIEYGTDPQILGMSVKSDEIDGVKEHQLNLSELVSGSKYYYRVSSSTGDGGAIVSETVEFTTLAVQDTIPPKIIAGPDPVYIEDCSVTLEWETDELSTSIAEYKQSDSGSDANWLSIWVDSDAQGVTKHKVVFSGLTPGTEYDYRVISYDLSEKLNKVYSRYKKFVTIALQDTIPPILVSGPIVHHSEKSAAFDWETDESSDSFVFIRTLDSTGTPVEANFRKFGDADKVILHSVTVTNLSPGQQYEFMLASRDLAGNLFVWPETVPVNSIEEALAFRKATQPPGGGGTFFTNQTADTQKPVIIEGPNIMFKTSGSITVEWKTDERSDSFVDYGIDTLYGSMKVDAIDVTVHRITLTNLSPATLYNFKVSSTDPNNNGPARSSNSAVSTDADEDNTPPKITYGPAAVSKTDEQATIIWETDESADTYLEFGIDDSYGTVRISTEDVKTHSMVLTNLEPATEYHYRVSSTDVSENGPTTSADMTFSTTSSPDLTAPDITEVAAQAVTDNLAVIVYKTDELGDTFIDYGLTENLGLSVGSSQDVFDHKLTLTNLAKGTKYYYKVGSIDKSGNKSVTATVSSSFTTLLNPDEDAPSAPAGIGIFSGDSELYMSWLPNNDNDFAGYNVYRGQTPGIFQMIQSLLTDNFYRDYGLTNGAIYFYKIEAVDFSGNISLSSSGIGEIPLAENSPTVPELFYPAEGQSLNNKAVTLIVNNSTKPAGRQTMTYEFVIAEEPDFFNQVAYADNIPEGEGQTYWQTGLVFEHGKEYHWKSRAFDGFFYSGWSQGKMFIADSLTVVGVDLVEFWGEDKEGAVELGWETASENDAAGFRLKRAADKNGVYQSITEKLIAAGRKNYRYTDVRVEAGRTYYYKLVSVSNSGIPKEYDPVEVRVSAPRVFRLHANYPNPFNPETTIKYEIPRREKVRILIYNVLGQVVKELVNEDKKPGYYDIKWRGTDNLGRQAASGIYFFRINAGKFNHTRKMILIR